MFVFKYCFCLHCRRRIEPHSEVCYEEIHNFLVLNTVTFMKLIIAVYASVPLCLYFLYMFVKSSRVQFPICCTGGLGCEGQWAKNLAVSPWMNIQGWAECLECSAGGKCGYAWDDYRWLEDNVESTHRICVKNLCCILANIKGPWQLNVRCQMCLTVG